MSERERWIIYPLLFFALGAALRDKFTHQVRTDNLHAGKIWCEELNVVDSEKPDRVVAKLTSNSPQKGRASDERFGVFVLIDSENRELCGVTNNQLQVNQIACKSVISQAVSVVDPQSPGKPLALLTSATATSADGSSRRLGSLLLTDSEGQEHFGLADDQIRTRQIICQGVAVVDPDDPRRVLAGLDSTAAPVGNGADGPKRIGVLALNNEMFDRLEGNVLRQEKPKRGPERRESTDDDEGT